MHSSLLIRFSALLLVLGASVSARGALIITIGAPGDIGTLNDTPLGPFDAGGSTITIPFFAHVTGTTSDNLTQFKFTIDIGGDGNGIPSDGTTDYFADFEAPGNAFGVYRWNPASNPLANYDYTLEWDGGATISGHASQPTMLFQLTFESSPSTPSGTYDVVAAQLDGGDYTPIPDVLFDQGQFQVQEGASAVPEPGSVALLTGMFAAGGAYRWRKRGRSIIDG